MPRTYKPVPECPSKLRQVIKAANRLPEKTNELFEKLGEFASEHNNRPFDENRNDYWNYHRKIAFERFENIIGDKPLAKWLVGKTDDFQLEAILNFAELVQARQVLRYIAETNRDEDSLGEDFLRRYYRLSPQGYQPFIKLFFYYDYGEAKFDFKTFDMLGFFAMLQDLKGSLHRIKLCPICDCVFWAKKTNALTCGNQKCIHGLQNKKKKLKEKNGTL